MRRILGFVVAILGLTLSSPVAHADIFAAACVMNGSNQDIAVLNAATGARRFLPGLVNTSRPEVNPTISSDGRRLAFASLIPDGAQLVLRLAVADLSTFQVALQLFDPFETTQLPINLSSITPNGATVATGRPLVNVFGVFRPRVTLTSLASFPFRPFSKSSLTPSRTYLTSGDVVTVAAGGDNLFALGIGPTNSRGEILLAQLGGASSPALRAANASYSRPALAASNPQLVYFVERIVTNGVASPGDIVYRPATLSGFVGTPTRVLSGVRTADEETLPALTSDGRYLGFVRGFDDGRTDRLFVIDTLTRILLAPNGIDLGTFHAHSGCGSLSIYREPLLASSVITSTGNVNATLLGASSIGIFVQRIVGKTRVFGQVEYQLETVGRFPLGSFGEGNVFTQWDFTVGGKPLPPGFYQVTVRAVDTDVVRELGKPQGLFIDVQGRPHVIGEDTL